MSDLTPVYLDCDTGIDDAIALAYLLAHPGVRLVGIGTVSGNVDAVRAAHNTLGLIAAAGRVDVPVAVGSRAPLEGRFDGGASRVHGVDGIGGVAVPEPRQAPLSMDAADLLNRLAREHAGDLHVVAIGPLTNLAVAAQRDAALPSRVRRMTVMGGALDVPGNVSPLAEANIHNDALAAHEVLRASWPITLVPLDVTLQHTFGEDEQQRLLSADPLSRLIGAMLETYMDFYSTRYGERRCALHDPLAAAIATGEVAPTRWETARFRIGTTDGHDHGQVARVLAGTAGPARSSRPLTARPDHSGAVLAAGDDAAARILRTILAPGGGDDGR